MKKERISIYKNYFYSIAYQILAFIIPIVTIPYMSRIFGANGIGIQSFTNSIVSYFALFAAFGTVTYGQREIARSRDDKQLCTRIFWEIEIVSILSTICSLGLWIAFVNITAEYYKIYYEILTMNVVAVAFDITWFFQGQEKFKYIVKRNICVKFIGVISLFVFIEDRSQLVLYMALLSLFMLLGNLSMWTYLPLFLVKVDIKELRPLRHLGNIIIYFIPTIAISVYTILDKSMIGIITGKENENGYYEQANTIITLGKSFVASFITVMSARMSYLFADSEKNGKEIKEKLQASIDYILFLTMPMMAGIIGTAHNFVPWYFGEGFGKVELLLKITSPLIPIVCLGHCISAQYLTPSGQRGRCIKVVIIGASSNFLLNLLLIPHYMSAGAALASVVAELIVALLYLKMSRDYISYKFILKKAWKKVVAAFIMLLHLMIFFKRYCGSLQITFIQIISGIIIYMLILWLLEDSSISIGIKYVKKVIHCK